MIQHTVPFRRVQAFFQSAFGLPSWPTCNDGNATPTEFRQPPRTSLAQSMAAYRRREGRRVPSATRSVWLDACDH